MNPHGLIPHALSPPQRLTLFAYGTLMQATRPLLRHKLLTRARQEPFYGHKLPERFARYTSHETCESRPLWIHAVSLGETRGVAPLMDALRERLPHLRLLLTHSTASGWRAGQDLLAPGDRQSWLPWDTPGATARFLERFRPVAGLLMETEVWPQLVQACATRQIPLGLVNARLNEKSFRRAKSLAWLARPAFAGLAGVWAQTPADAARLHALGAPVRGVPGNLKAAQRESPALEALARNWRLALGDRPVLMFASSREGEESRWLKAWQKHRATRPEGTLPLWLIVPRHPTRFDTVARELEHAGFRVFRRRDWGSSTARAAATADIWLGDSMGEMPAYYRLAQAALLGGSFEPLGGHNLLEALSCGCPMVLGPHTFNFHEAARDAESCGAARRAADLAHALTLVESWLQAPEDLACAAQAGQRWIARAHGVVQAYADALTPWLASRLSGGGP